MTKRPSFAEARIEVGEDNYEEQPAPEPDEPFRILILGDFSGRANRGVRDATLSGRRPIAVDRDNLDLVLSKASPELHLPLSDKEGHRITLKFKQLDDFHPDRIYERVDLFQALRQTRQELGDPATFDRAAATLQPPTPASNVVSITEHEKGFSLDNLLDQTLEKTKARSSEQARPGLLQDDWDRFVHDIAAPHRVPGAPANQAALIAQLDAAISSQMRSVLHHADFQSLEAAWRSLYFLVSRLETGTELKLFILDITKAELLAMLASSESIRRTEIFRLLVDQSVGTPGAPRWAVLVGNYTFDAIPREIGMLACLGDLARNVGAPFLASASPHFLGCSSLAEYPDPDDWSLSLAPEVSEALKDLRQLPEAVYLGLVLPRLLLRSPYGKGSDATERFDFDEMPDPPRHESYLWGNPAFACACLLGQAFSQYGWEFRPGMINEVENLPAYVYQQAGESILKPCAEILMTERAAERILDQGIMPLASLHGRDSVRLVRFQSFADPPTALAGRWF